MITIMKAEEKISRLGKQKVLLFAARAKAKTKKSINVDRISKSNLVRTQSHEFLFYYGKGINLPWLTWNEWLTFFVLHSAKQRFERSISSKSSLCKDKHTKRRKFNFWAQKKILISVAASKHEKVFFQRILQLVVEVHWNLFDVSFSLVTSKTCMWKIIAGKIEAKKVNVKTIFNVQ